jgi:hypothetical protein
MHVTIALLQMAACSDPSDLLNKGERFCRRAQAMGADLVLFPETWNALASLPHPDGDLRQAPELWSPPRRELEALEQRRREQVTQAFKERYQARAGVESAHAQALRRCDVRRAAYAGQSFATAEGITYVTEVATTHLNRRAHPWVWGRPPLKSRKLRRHFVYPL